MAEELSPARARELIPPQALAPVPGYSAAARVTALAGGAINKTFCVETPEGRFILRLHDAAGIALGAHHLREARLQSAAAAVGIAPRVVHVDPSQRFMISEYLDGRVWTPADFTDVDSLRRLGGTLRRLHEIKPPIPAPFDLGALLSGFSERIVRADPAARAAMTQLMQRARVSLRECGTDARTPALFHSDLHHSNILEAGGRLFLIDWEYAAVGDPLNDLACLLAYYPQAVPHARALLESSGLAPEATPAMLEHATWLYGRLNHLWDRVRLLDAGNRAPTPAD
jgi:thiamine kinase